MRNAESLQRTWRRWRGSFAGFMKTLDRDHVPYLSHSKISTVERCPQCYYAQYILGKKPSSDALTTGTLFHRAAAAFYEAIQSNHPTSRIVRQLSPKHPNPTDRPFLNSAIKTMRRNVWQGYEIVSVESLFFMDLAAALPPVIGVVDLILKQDNSYIVVDHKTSKRFGAPDADQLVLYAEYVKRFLGAGPCVGAFDEYRLVLNLKRARKAVFRRTHISVETSRLQDLIRRYRKGWKAIEKIHREGKAISSNDCWYCNPWNYQSY